MSPPSLARHKSTGCIRVVVMMASFFEDDVDVADSDDGEDDNDW